MVTGGYSFGVGEGEDLTELQKVLARRKATVSDGIK